MEKTSLTAIRITGEVIAISYNSNEYLEAWLENTNKHYPHILAFDTDSEKQTVVINRNVLQDFLNRYPGYSFKLSLCNARTRLHYLIPDHIRAQFASNPCITIKDDVVFFRSDKATTAHRHRENEPVREIGHVNRWSFRSIDRLPINTLNIGSCFSRSIFKSDAYFNPTYKTYFSVKNTLFHNSFISLFSDSIADDYSATEDLITGDAGLYTGIEFSKNVSTTLETDNYKLVVVDNYIDAAVPVIRLRENAYLTYNKYFSESIFKRFFSPCDVIYPGTEAHTALYRKSISAFRALLDTCQIKNVVLVGGRLSRYKTDEKTLHTEQWDNKMDWIAEVNHNWDIADQLFLQEFPDAIYLDKRSTRWKSDVHSPIIGGASPSHYQRGYYKELFEDLLQFIDEDVIYGH